MGQNRKAHKAARRSEMASIKAQLRQKEDELAAAKVELVRVRDVTSRLPQEASPSDPHHLQSSQDQLSALERQAVVQRTVSDIILAVVTHEAQRECQALQSQLSACQSAHKSLSSKLSLSLRLMYKTPDQDMTDQLESCKTKHNAIRRELEASQARGVAGQAALKACQEEGVAWKEREAAAVRGWVACEAKVVGCEKELTVAYDIINSLDQENRDLAAQLSENESKVQPALDIQVVQEDMCNNNDNTNTSTQQVLSSRSSLVSKVVGLFHRGCGHGGVHPSSSGGSSSSSSGGSSSGSRLRVNLGLRCTSGGDATSPPSHPIKVPAGAPAPPLSPPAVSGGQCGVYDEAEFNLLKMMILEGPTW